MRIDLDIGVAQARDEEGEQIDAGVNVFIEYFPADGVLDQRAWFNIEFEHDVSQPHTEVHSITIYEPAFAAAIGLALQQEEDVEGLFPGVKVVR